MTSHLQHTGNALDLRLTASSSSPPPWLASLSASLRTSQGARFASPFPVVRRVRRREDRNLHVVRAVSLSQLFPFLYFRFSVFPSPTRGPAVALLFALGDLVRGEEGGCPTLVVGSSVLPSVPGTWIKQAFVGRSRGLYFPISVDAVGGSCGS